MGWTIWLASPHRRNWCGSRRASENELELDRGQILHLVDHHKIIAGLDQGQVLGAQEVGIVIIVLLHKRQILTKQVIDVRPLVRGKDRLPDAEPQIRLPAQVRVVRGRSGDDTLEFLKERVGVFEVARGAVAGKPLGKILQPHLPAVRHTQAREVFRERQETDVLGVVRILEGIVQIARVLHQIGRAGDIQHVTRRCFHFLEREDCLATPRRADHDAGWWERVDRLLGVVERNHLIEQMEGGQLGVHICQGRRFGLLQVIHGGEFALVDGPATA